MASLYSGIEIISLTSSNGVLAALDSTKLAGQSSSKLSPLATTRRVAAICLSSFAKTSAFQSISRSTFLDSVFVVARSAEVVLVGSPCSELMPGTSAGSSVETELPELEEVPLDSQ
jgi:hypothetical protein